MAVFPLSEAQRAAPQPVHPDIIAPHLKRIADYTAAVEALATQTLPDGAITPESALAIGSALTTIRAEAEAIAEHMRLKVTSLDAVAAIAGDVAREKVTTEADLYKRLRRRGFRSADIRPAIVALIERGTITRTPTGDAPKPWTAPPLARMEGEGMTTAAEHSRDRLREPNHRPARQCRRT